MRSPTPRETVFRSSSAGARLLRSPLAAFLSAALALAAIWAAAGPNSAAEITGDARYYLALWAIRGRPRRRPSPTGS